MVELIEANWILLVIALVIGVLVAWWVFVSSRRTKVEIEARDEAEDAPRSKRNQALIDAPPAARSSPASGAAAVARDAERAATGSGPAIPPPVPMGLAGAGEVVQAEAEAAPAPEARIVPEEEPASAPGPSPAPGPTPAPSLSPAPDTVTATDDILAPTPVADETPVASTLHVPAEPTPTPPPPAAHEANSVLAPTIDDLTRIKGLGPKIQVRLHELGVVNFAQIADWDEAEVDRIDAQLDKFQGRIRRDNWVEQARMLAAGDTAAYEQRFGKL